MTLFFLNIFHADYITCLCLLSPGELPPLIGLNGCGIQGMSVRDAGGVHKTTGDPSFI